jgi:dipeptidyl aminopeptidase/acylaminoacyl peptidase
MVVAASVGLGGPQLVGGRVWWSEARPHEGGRVQLVHRPVHGDGAALDVLPEGVSARSRAHEYGGGAWWATATGVVYTDAGDQGLYRLDLDEHGRPQGAPVALTPAPAVPMGDRYADARPTEHPSWWVAVRERDANAPSARDELVAVRIDPDGAPTEPVTLRANSDFASNPRPGPDGQLCWLEWDHPDMPWQTTTLWSGRLEFDGGPPRLVEVVPVAGNGDESLAQPGWLPDGRLAVVSDADNWWNLWSFPEPGLPQPGTATQLTVVAGELAPPQWVFGQATWATTGAGDVVGIWRADGNDHLGILPAGTDEIHWVHSGHTAFDGVAVTTDADGAASVAVVAGSYSREFEVATIGFDELLLAARAGTHAAMDVRRPPRDLGLGPEWSNWPEAISVPVDGTRTHALVYPPCNPDVDPDGDAATDGTSPLMVLIHGGPTSSARPVLSLAVRYWTSRGWTVADVNYRGSTGFGRRYRQRLHEAWGVVDVDDCIAVARWLADEGRVDAQRRVIRGGSAGGFTTLAALCASDVFAAGASLYGIADLELLAAETHRFEAGYNDWLLGALPEHADRYRDRSPIHRIGDLDQPLLVLHGADDAVVPPSQAEIIVSALRARGVPVGYLLFEREQHGFRQADTLERALAAEAHFFARVLDLGPGLDPAPVVIEPEPRQPGRS